MIKHLVYIFVKFLSVLVRIVVKVCRGNPAENQVLGPAVKDIYDQTSHLMIGNSRCCRIAPAIAPSPTAPAPTAPPAAWKAAVVGLQFLLIMNIALRENRGIAAGLDQLPAFLLKIFIYLVFNA